MSSASPSPSHEEKKHEASSFDPVKGEKRNNAAATADEALGQHYVDEAKRVDAGGIDTGYERKVFLLNKVMQEEIGMGRVSSSVNGAG